MTFKWNSLPASCAIFLIITQNNKTETEREFPIKNYCIIFPFEVFHSSKISPIISTEIFPTFPLFWNLSTGVVMQILTIPSIMRGELSRKVPSRRANRRSPHYHNKILFVLCSARPPAKCFRWKLFVLQKVDEIFHFLLRNLKRARLPFCDGKAEKILWNWCNSIFPKTSSVQFIFHFKSAVKKTSETCRRTSGCHSSSDLCEKWNWTARQTEQRISS